MPNPENLKPFTSERQPENRGRPKGSLNRKTIIAKWLEVSEEFENPITGKIEKMTQYDITTLALIKKAREGDVAAFKELYDSVFGKIVNQTDITSNGETLPIFPNVSTNDRNK